MIHTLYETEGVRHGRTLALKRLAFTVRLQYEHLLVPYSGPRRPAGVVRQTTTCSRGSDSGTTTAAARMALAGLMQWTWALRLPTDYL